MKKLLPYFLLIILFISCKKDNAPGCFKSNGEIISEFRYPGTFTKLEMHDKIDFTVTKGSECKVELLAGEHIIRKISVKVENGILTIENLNKCNVVRGHKKRISARITVPYLQHALNNSVASLVFDESFSQDTLKVNAESSGDIYVNGTYDYLKAESNGNGDLYLKGKTKFLRVFTNGTNYVRGQDLEVSEYVFIQTLSIGDCFLNATNLNMLDYRINNDGNIYYKGSPALLYGECIDKARGRAIQQN